MTEDGKKLLLKIRLAEQAERYDDMVRFITKLIKTCPESYVDNSILPQLSVAFKNAVGERRAAWRSLEEFGEGGEEEEEEQVHCYQDNIGQEVQQYCSQMMDLLDKHLMSRFPTGSDHISLLKLKADYLRYMAEVQSGQDREESAKESDAAYTKAFAHGRKEMSTCDPVFLELALNHSVLKFEVMNKQEEACQIAKQAFEGALKDVGQEEGERYSHSNATLQILRDNLVKWTL